MTDTQLSTPTQADTIEQVVIGGDLSKLNSNQRVNYYRMVCQSIGLNPLTKPFDYITLNGRLVLYAKKDATDQIRDLRKVSITKLERERIEDIYTVTAYAQSQDGRQDSSIGAVSIANLKGDALANAIMKAETKAKRRVTLSICGLGMLDETELETIPELKAIPTEGIPASDKTPIANLPEPWKYDSKGRRYDELPLPELSFHFNGLMKQVKDNGMTDEEREFITHKRDYVQSLIKQHSSLKTS